MVLRVRGPLLGCLGLETEFEVHSIINVLRSVKKVVEHTSSLHGAHLRVTKTFYMTYMLQVLSGEDGDEVVGRIRKVWGGEAKERYTDAERFEVHCQYRCKHIL